jgi:hypothetical protein
LVMHMVNIKLDVYLQRNISSQNPSVLWYKHDTGKQFYYLTYILRMNGHHVTVNRRNLTPKSGYEFNFYICKHMLRKKQHCKVLSPLVLTLLLKIPDNKVGNKLIFTVLH